MACPTSARCKTPSTAARPTRWSITPSTCSGLTATTGAPPRCWIAARGWQNYWPPTARPCCACPSNCRPTRTACWPALASWAWKGSSANAPAPPTAAGARPTGSSSNAARATNSSSPALPPDRARGQLRASWARWCWPRPRLTAPCAGPATWAAGSTPARWRCSKNASRRSSRQKAPWPTASAPRRRPPSPGCGPNWWRRSRTPASPATATCATRCSRACAKTKPSPNCVPTRFREPTSPWRPPDQREQL